MKIAFFILLSCLLMNSCKSAKESNTTVVDQAERSNEESGKSNQDKSNRLEKEIAQLQESLSDSVIARIQRTPCFGTCPIYTMTIYQGGYVRYHGEKFVDKEGHYEGRTAKKKIAELMKLAEEADFFEMKREYDNPRVTDLPSTIVTIAKEDSFKTVINRYGGPQSLSDFQQNFEELFKDIRWEKVESEQEK